MLLRDFRLGACCLTILIYTFIMFKGALNMTTPYLRLNRLWG